MLQLLPAMRAERTLLTEDLDGMKPLDIRQLALVAWGDAKRANEFMSRVYADRIWHQAGQRLENQDDPT